ncbi:hypothetical protein L3Q82_025305, partial [Scortum barcoo]
MCCSCLSQRSRIQVWLYEQVNMRIEGCIIGFDEYMNLVLDDAEEVHMKTKNRKPLGKSAFHFLCLAVLNIDLCTLTDSCSVLMLHKCRPFSLHVIAGKAQ